MADKKPAYSFGGSLSHNALPGLPLLLHFQVLCIYIMVSCFGFLWHFCVGKCVRLCDYLFLYFVFSLKAHFNMCTV